MAHQVYVEAKRELGGLTAGVEKRLLVWMAERMPAAVNSDHLTGLALVAMVGAGLAYWASSGNPAWLHVVNVCLFLNWFGDSLDGTLARVRHRLRPRYGYYVDHIVDAFGALFLLGGLALSGSMTMGIALGLLIAYYALFIDIALATHVLGVFKISRGAIGGTELRLLLAAFNLVLLGVREVALFDRVWLLGDLAGVAGIAGLLAVLIASVVKNGRTLYELERLA